MVIRGLNLIPEACQFPEYTGARLTIDDSEIIAGNFDEKGFLQSFPLVSFGKPHGVMTISVRKHDIASPGEAFLPEELELFGAIAIRLGKYKELSELNISKKKGEQLYHSILAASPDLITITDLTGRVTYTSDRVRQMFGVPDQESVIGKTLFEYIDPACRPKAASEIALMLEGQLTGAGEYIGLKQDGSRFDIEVNGEFIRDENGQPVQMIFVTRDITRRKEIERELKQREEKFRHIFETIRDVYFEISPEGVIVAISPSVARLTKGQYKREEMIGRSMFDYISDPGERQKYLEALQRKNNIDDYEVSFLNGDGSLIPVSISSGYLFDKDHLPAGIAGTIRDNTQRKQAYEELRKFSTITDKANYGVAIANIDGTLIYANPYWARIHGYEIRELRGKNISEFHTEEQQEHLMEAILLLHEKRELESFELHHVRKDGTTFPTLMNAILVFEKGTPLFMSATAIDITEMKNTQEAVRKSEEMLNYAQVIANMGSWDMNIRDGSLKWSKNCYALFEKDEKTYQPTVENYVNNIHPEDVLTVDAMVQEALKTGLPVSFDVRAVMPDGRIKWITNHCVPKFEKGELVAIHGAVLDITTQKLQEKEILELNVDLEKKITQRTAQLVRTNDDLIKEIEMRRQVEDELKTRTLELEQFFTVSPDLLSIGNTTGKFIKVNKAWEELLGLPVSDIITKNFIDFIHPDDIDSTTTKLSMLMKQQMITRFTNRYRTADGTYRFLEWNTVPVGELIYSAARDVTERMRKEEQLMVARKEAEQANHAKSEFLSRMSHELRTPMNSILGFAQLLERGELNPGQRKGVGHILKSGAHLLDLINEVLDLSRIEAGRLSITPEAVDVALLIREMADLVQPQLTARQISLTFHQSGATACFVLADRQKLRQILLNLISNAIKYNSEGGTIVITTETLPPHSTLKKPVRISVKDSGTGISQENLTRLFIPFERIGAEKTETEGTGLGLALAQQLVRLMGGEIGVDSTTDVGSTFWIELPGIEGKKDFMKKMAAGDSRTKGLSRYSGTLLYVEDNPSNTELMFDIIEHTRPGLSMHVVVKGKEVREKVKEIRPDLILLDLNLPDIHGYEVCEILNSDPETNSVPVIIITADAISIKPEILQHYHICEYLTKPLNINNFINSIDKILKSGSTDTTA